MSDAESLSNRVFLGIWAVSYIVFLGMGLLGASYWLLGGKDFLVFDNSGIRGNLGLFLGSFYIPWQNVRSVFVQEPRRSQFLEITIIDRDHWFERQCCRIRIAGKLLVLEQYARKGTIRLNLRCVGRVPKDIFESLFRFVDAHR
jgi:hypothetical protein